MSLYTNFNYAKLEEAYGTSFKGDTDKKIVTDPATPQYKYDNE